MVKEQTIEMQEKRIEAIEIKKIEIKKQKIAYFIDSLVNTAGMERIFIDKANYLAETFKYDVSLITLSQNGNEIVYPISKKVNHIDLGINHYEIYKFKGIKQLLERIKKRDLLQKRIKEIINRGNYDIIDTPSLLIANELLCIKSKAHKIFESHIIKDHIGNNDGTVRNIIRNYGHLLLRDRELSRISQYFDCIVVLTERDQELWKNSRMVVKIPNMTYISDLESQRKKRNVCVSMGRLVYQKNHSILIHAWKAIHERHKDWELKIYGEGPEFLNLNNLITDLKLTDCISILKPDKNIHNILDEAKIFAFSSLYEGFGLVLIEAMAMGIPCVSTDCPAGPSEIITNGIDGVLVENNNSKSLEEGILMLIENEELRKKMGEKAKESIKCFSPDEIMSKWKNLFETLSLSK